MTRLSAWLAGVTWPRRVLLVFLAWAVGSSLNHGDYAGAFVALAVGVVFLAPRGSGSGFRRPVWRRSSAVFATRVPRFAGMASARGDERSEANSDQVRPRPATGKAVAE